MFLYLDLIWLLNFGIDYLLLWMTAVFRNVSFHRWRMALAAAIGASYVLFLFFPPLQGMYTLLVKIAFSAALILIAFGYCSWQRYVSLFLTFYFVSFVTGGGLFAVHYFMQSQHDVMQGMLATQGNGFGHPVSWWFVIVGFPVMLLFSHFRWKKIERLQATSRQFVQVVVHIGHHEISCRGLIDTGNRLYEPFTRTPVIMLDMQKWRHIFPPEILQALEDGQLWQLHQSRAIGDDWLTRIQLVPFRGVGRQSDIMLTVRPDQLVVSDGTTTWATGKVLLGLQREALSAGGDFEAIVHPDVLLPEFEQRPSANKEAM